MGSLGAPPIGTAQEWKKAPREESRLQVRFTEDDLPADRDDLGPFDVFADQARDPEGGHDGVRVRAGEDLPRRGGEAGRERATVPTLGLADDAYAAGAGHARGPVGAAVVDDDDLDRAAVILPRERV